MKRGDRAREGTAREDKIHDHNGNIRPHIINALTRTLTDIPANTFVSSYLSKFWGVPHSLSVFDRSRKQWECREQRSTAVETPFYTVSLAGGKDLSTSYWFLMGNYIVRKPAEECARLVMAIKPGLAKQGIQTRNWMFIVVVHDMMKGWTRGPALLPERQSY